MIPQLSLQERDRRYQIVRAEMAKRGIDCLDSAGKHRAVGTTTRRLTLPDFYWRFRHRSVHRLPSRRRRDRVYFQPRRLVETGAKMGRRMCATGAIAGGKTPSSGSTSSVCRKARSAFPGFAGLFRAPEGIIPYSSVKAIQDAFPQAKIVNATEMMQEIRAVKSAEEVSLLERSAVNCGEDHRSDGARTPIPA